MRTSIALAVAIVACYFDQAIAASSQDIAKARTVSAFLAQAASCKLPTDGLVRSYWAWIDKTFPDASADRLEWLPQFMQAAQRTAAVAANRDSCEALASARRLNAISAMLQHSERSIADARAGVRAPLRAAPGVKVAAQRAKSATANRAQPKKQSPLVETAWWNRTPVANR